MALLLLIRHAVTDQTGKRLYGRSDGVRLSEEGRAQAEALAQRLDPIALRAIYVSPMDRCAETAAPLAARRRLRPIVVSDLNEVDYGEWTGRSFASLRRTKMWQRVRLAPASVRFPGGESLADVQVRAVRALREIAERHGGDAVALITHGDVVRLALAHHAGVHLDLFQRLEVSTASVTALSLEDGASHVLRVNDTGTLSDLARSRRRAARKVRG